MPTALVRRDAESAFRWADEALAKLGVRRTIIDGYVEVVAGEDPVTKRSMQEAIREALAKIDVGSKKEAG